MHKFEWEFLLRQNDIRFTVVAGVATPHILEIIGNSRCIWLLLIGFSLMSDSFFILLNIFLFIPMITEQEVESSV